MQGQSTSRGWLPFRIGLGVGLLSQFFFMIAYSIWAEHQYPQRNSMAGFAGWIYGFWAGLLLGVIAAAVTVWLRKHPSQV